MNRITSSLVTIVLLGAWTWASDVRQDYDRSQDFQQFETFAWMPDTKLPNPRHYDAKLVDGWIRSAIDEELSKKGITKTESEQPQLRVTYFPYLKESLDIGEQGNPGTTIQMQYGHWRAFGNPLPDTRLRVEGSVVVDLVNPATKKLVWRGTVTEVIKEKDTKNPQKAGKKVRKLISKLFKKFPRKK